MHTTLFMCLVVTFQFAAIANANAAIRDFARSRYIHPGASDFSGRSATAFHSVSLTDYQGAIGILASSGGAYGDPQPWTSIVGSTVGDATFTGYTQQSATDLVFHYTPNTQNPSPQTRLQWGYDFVPRVIAGSDGYFHLQFNVIDNLNNVGSSLHEVEIILDGQWTLGLQGTGGVTLTQLPFFTPIPFDVGDNFTYYPETNTTRFYASRIVTNPGADGGMAYRVDLIGAAVPSGGGLGLVGVGGVVWGVGVARRRRG